MRDYTGLGALGWAQFSVDEPDPDQRFFEWIIDQHAGPALDVGCGTGRLLIPSLLAGLEVDGIDPSVEMLALCCSKAAERGLTPQLYQQEMQGLDLDRCYHTIFIPCGTIQLVVDRSQVFEEQRCDAPECWYFKHEIELMVERIGFRTLRLTGDYTDEEERDSHYVLAFAAIK